MDMAVGTSEETHEQQLVDEPADELYPEDGTGSEAEARPGTGALESVVGITTYSEVVQESVERYSQSVADEMGAESQMIPRKPRPVIRGRADSRWRRLGRRRGRGSSRG